jgi:hypothetical protein
LPGQSDLEKSIQGFDHVKAAMAVYIMTNS